VKRHTFIGLLLYALAATLSIIGLAPISIMTFFAGYMCASVFNIVPAFFVAFFLMISSATAGSTLAFMVGRFLIRDCISDVIRRHKKFQAIDNGLRHNGFNLVALLRCSVLVPYNIFSYFMSVTSGKAL